MKPAKHASERAAVVAVALAAALVVDPGAVEARIMKTRGLGGQHQLSFTIGSGFEYETDPEESDYGYPFLLECELTKDLKISLEPSYAQIRSKPGQRGTNISGSGDFESTLEYEFVHERRYRPAFSAQGVLKFPTAAHEAIGTHQYDYSMGLIVSKEFVGFDMDFNALYTIVGSPPGQTLNNTSEFSLASEWHVRPSLDLEAEVVTSTGGGIHGQVGTLTGFGAQAGPGNEKSTEGTIGLAEHLNDFLKLEEGVVAKSDGTWQFVFAWEWDFGGR